jgi:hypothetical protein
MWRYQSRVKEGRVDEWNDFWKFVEFAGERESKAHAARRHDVRSQWGPQNFYWFKREQTCEDVNAYQRAWHKRNPMRAKSFELKRMFGISVEDYMRMYETQNGCCDICGQRGDEINGGDRRTSTLAVDHCHETGRIRSLLCASCNRGLGLLKDSPDILEKAIAYLRKHST